MVFHEFFLPITDLPLVLTLPEKVKHEGVSIKVDLVRDSLLCPLRVKKTVSILLGGTLNHNSLVIL